MTENANGLLWIDTSNGTWGEVDSDTGRLVIVDTDTVIREVGDPHHVGDDHPAIAALEGMSDSDVADFGLDHGLTPTLTTTYLVVWTSGPGEPSVLAYSDLKSAESTFDLWSSATRALSDGHVMLYSLTGEIIRVISHT